MILIQIGRMSKLFAASCSSVSHNILMA